MIARVWRGETAADQADRYYDYLLETGAAEVRRVPGNAGVNIWRRTTGDATEFVFISYWTSMEAIHAFAGPDVGQAVYYAADRQFLRTLQPHVDHYEIALDDRS